jgi:hypothetical protein
MIYEVKMHGAQCDNCGEAWENSNTGCMAYHDPETIREQIMNDDWLSEGGKDYCPDCYSYDDEDNLILKPMVNNLELHKQITFHEFVQHGKDNGANIVNGMPWSWQINGKAVTHENDNRYLVETVDGIKDFGNGESLIAFKNGLQILKDYDTHSPGGCPM